MSLDNGSVQLEKFYLDVVADDGSGCIAYAARVDGFGLRSTVAATLSWPSTLEGAAVQRRTLRGRLPEVWSDGLGWACPSLHAEGVWSGGVNSERHILYERGAGMVGWAPLLPRVPAKIRIGGTEIRGIGYAERLVVSVAPWQLPIRTLLWGRFTGVRHSVVWIDWQHAEARRWLWHDGVRQPVAAIDEVGAVWGSWALRLERGRLLRDGRLGQTVFGRWPLLRRLLPKQLQALHEAKQCSRGVLTGPGGEHDEGWVIHERVEFP